MMNIAILGIDLDKTVCSLAGLDNERAIIFRRRIKRLKLQNFRDEHSLVLWLWKHAEEPITLADFA